MVGEVISVAQASHGALGCVWGGVLTCSVKKSDPLFSPLFFSEAGHWEEKSLQKKNGTFNPNPMLLERPRRSVL